LRQIFRIVRSAICNAEIDCPRLPSRISRFAFCVHEQNCINEVGDYSILYLVTYNQQLVWRVDLRRINSGSTEILTEYSVGPINQRHMTSFSLTTLTLSQFN
jgi:hypothetical protein